LHPFVRSGNGQRRVLVTGGAGYVGSRLVPALLRRGYGVRVLDALLFGTAGVETWHPGAVELVVGDIRDDEVTEAALRGIDTVVHLAAMANDPSADLDEDATLEINLHAVRRLIDAAERSGVERFVTASSASVYGVQEDGPADESAPLRPITLYGRCKAESEEYVLERNGAGFTTSSIRAATVCGYSPRQRLDLTVNIFTYQVVVEGHAVVHGGAQVRPNIHVDDLVDAYLEFVEAPPDAIGGRAFNVGWENLSIAEVVSLVGEKLERPPEIEVVPVVDARSYALVSDHVTQVLGLRPKRTVADAIAERAAALQDGRIVDPASAIYRNVEHLKANGWGRVGSRAGT
jgi:nucleoside-diphosphate-sugar epimerase